MSANHIRRIEELIEMAEKLRQTDKETLNSFLKQVKQIFIEIFGNKSEFEQNLQSLKFFPTKSYFTEMSEQVHQNSWQVGKEKLITILKTALEDLKSFPRVTALVPNSNSRERTSTNLQILLKQIKKREENEFLEEAIKCFEVGACRASIIMVWNLTIDHLFEFILVNELPAFNNALSANTDKRIKIKAVLKKDDFSEIPENKFLEFCRTSKILSKDVIKILDAKLGIRNTYAHPSNVKINESKVIDFIEDLITNVVLKYNVS